MLSDVLFEAMQDMEFYQEQYPNLYEKYREEIETLKSLMEVLRVKLEIPPGILPAPRS